MKTNYEYYMEADLAAHTGKWIAICDSRIVSEGNEAKEVFRQAKSRCQNKRILLTKVPGEETMIF